MALAEKLDVLVMGGGPAGAAAAINLAKAGAKTLLVESSQYDRFRVGETLPPEVFPLLVELGVEDILQDSGHLSSPGTVSAWENEEPYENDFVFSPYGVGWHLDRLKFDQALVNKARQAGVELACGTRAVECSRQKPEWRVRLQSPTGERSIMARWIIDATGRSSWFARKQGRRRLCIDKLVGLLRIAHLQQDDTRTLTEAMPGGWWYSSLLPKNKAIAIFFTDLDLYDFSAKGRKKLWQDQWEASRLTRERFCGSEFTTEQCVVSAASTYLNSPLGEAWLAVGDAACTLDPLSSQGIKWALSSGLAAAEAILSNNRINEYSQQIRQNYLDYLNIRTTYYSQVQRCHDSQFWLRRRSAPSFYPVWPST